VDLEQLRITNSQYNQKILEKNKELFQLKRKGGKMVQVLNIAKHELAEELKRSKNLEKKIEERDGTIRNLQDKIKAIQQSYEKEKILKENTSQGMESFAVMEYVNQKSEEAELIHKVQAMQNRIH